MEEELENIKKLEEALSRTKYVEEIEEDLDDDEVYNFALSDESSDDEDSPHILCSDEEFNEQSLSLVKPSHSEINLKSIKLLLSQEELELIENCTDPHLQELMILNRHKHIQLNNARVEYSNLLYKVTNALHDIHTVDTKSKDNRLYKAKMGFPYFKDVRYFRSPRSLETIRKHANGIVSSYYFQAQPKWTLNDQSMLKMAIKQNFNKVRIDARNKVIENLRTVINTCDDDQKEGLLKCVDDKIKEIAVIKNEDVFPNDDSDLDWNEIAHEFSGRHSAGPCQAFWTIYLNPKINSKTFSKDELKKLKEIAEKYKEQDWDRIALELGNGRSAFLTCAEYFSKIFDSNVQASFTKEEDKKLLDLVEKYKIGSYIPWMKISSHFVNKRMKQIYCRFQYRLNIGPHTTGYFSQAEDVLLHCLYNRFENDVQAYLQYMPNRTINQIRHRLNNYIIKDSLILGNWTLEEDKKVWDFGIKYSENGRRSSRKELESNKNWAHLASKMKRNRYHIRQRFICLKKLKAQYPDKSIEELPRRRHYLLNLQSKRLSLLKLVADFFGDNIPTLKEIEAVLEKRKSLDQSIIKSGAFKNFNLLDSQLVTFFTKNRKDGQSGKIEFQKRNEFAAILQVLRAFQAKLTIPNDETLQNNEDLDEIDLEFLSMLRKESAILKPEIEPNPNTSRPNSVSCLVPPNLSTVKGLRNVLIKQKIFREKTERCDINTCASNIEDEMCDLTKDPSLIKHHCRLFKQRLFCLLKWPCILSLNKPNDITSKLSKSLESTSEKNLQISTKPKQPVSKPIGARELKRVRMEKVHKMAEIKRMKKDPEAECNMESKEVPASDASTSNVASTSKINNPQIKRSKSPLGAESPSTSESTQNQVLPGNKTKYILKSVKVTRANESDENKN